MNVDAGGWHRNYCPYILYTPSFVTYACSAPAVRLSLSPASYSSARSLHLLPFSPSERKSEAIFSLFVTRSGGAIVPGNWAEISIPSQEGICASGRVVKKRLHRTFRDIPFFSSVMESGWTSMDIGDRTFSTREYNRLQYSQTCIDTASQMSTTMHARTVTVSSPVTRTPVYLGLSGTARFCLRLRSWR